MGSVSKVNELKSGEIVRVASLFGLPAEGVYRVRRTSSSLVELSCGEVFCGCHPSLLIIKERNLPEPISWLNEEIGILKNQVRACDCADCRQILKRKEIELAGIAN